MRIQEIYEKFDAIGCLTFSTINDQNEPESRIAHLRGWDEDGIYFMTMVTKEFYRQLNATGKLSICGLNAKSQVTHDQHGMPVFEGCYAIRMTGDVREVSMDDLKAKNNPIFDLCIKDYEQYHAMVVFCIVAGNGDIFDYDFEKINRDNKLERTYFAYHDRAIKEKGLLIDLASCIQCGLCQQKCSFQAIQQVSGTYRIDPYRCDECGDCFLNCPVKAIHHGGTI